MDSRASSSEAHHAETIETGLQRLNMRDDTATLSLSSASQQVFFVDDSSDASSADGCDVPRVHFDLPHSDDDASSDVSATFNALFRKYCSASTTKTRGDHIRNMKKYDVHLLQSMQRLPKMQVEYPNDTQVPVIVPRVHARQETARVAPKAAPHEEQDVAAAPAICDTHVEQNAVAVDRYEQDLPARIESAVVRTKVPTTRHTGLNNETKIVNHDDDAFVRTEPVASGRGGKRSERRSTAEGIQIDNDETPAEPTKKERPSLIRRLSSAVLSPSSDSQRATKATTHGKSQSARFGFLSKKPHNIRKRKASSYRLIRATSSNVSSKSPQQQPTPRQTSSWADVPDVSDFESFLGSPVVVVKSVSA